MKRIKQVVFQALALAAAAAVAGCASIKVRNLENKKDTVSVLTYKLTTTIDAPVKDVWELTKKWNTYTVGYAKYDTTSGKGYSGVGEHSTGEASLAGNKIKWNEVVVQWQDERLVRFAYGSTLRGSLTISMEPVGDKTRYSFIVHTFFLPDNTLSRTLNSLL